MSDFQDPPRLFDLPDTPEALKSGLREAGQDGLGEDAVDRVAAGVLLDLGPSGAPPADGATLGAGTSGLTAKLVAGVVGVGILAGGLWMATRPDPPVGANTPPEIPAVAEPTLSAVPPAQPSQDSDMPASQSTTSRRPTNTKPAVTASAATGSTSTLAEEHRLLRAARRALPVEPARALALAREHERRFPQGVLAQEREVIAIQALAAMGEGNAAREKADGFDRKYPGSPHRHRVDEATDAEKKSSPVP